MIKELSQKAKQTNVRKLASNVMNNNSGLITNKVRQQLTVGENSDGNDIGRLKSDPYARRKKQRGGQAPFGVPDLNFSGNLYKGLDTGFIGFRSITDSSVSYSKYQKGRYGKNIYELQKENQKDAEFELSDKIVREYENSVGVQF